MRSTSFNSGGVKCKSAGRRPRSDTVERRTIARARNPSARSRWRAQVIEEDRPSKTNATELTFCRTPMTALTRVGSGSGGAEPLDRGHLAHEQVDHLWIPLA